MAAGFYDFTVRSKNFICAYLLVFYCVIVDEYRNVSYQSNQEYKKNGDKVLINRFLLNLKISYEKQNVNNRNNRNGIKLKHERKKTAKGRTILNLRNKSRAGQKWRILEVNKAWKHKIKTRRPKRLFLKFLNFSKTFSIYYCLFSALFREFTNSINISNYFNLNEQKASPNVRTNLRFKCQSQLAKNVKRKTPTNDNIIAVKIIRRRTIRKLLIMGGVEINPGPTLNTLNTSNTNMQRTKSGTFDIITYNCNGLAVRDKRRRILQKASKITRKGGIVMLQETHITIKDQVQQYFEGKFQLNSYKSNSAGVITLIGDDFEVIYTDKCEKGRSLYMVVERKGERLILANVYCPNDHKTSITFVEEVYTKILEIINIYPDCHIVLAGDFNSCISEIDFLNRNKTKIESELTRMVEQNNEVCNLTDSYRHIHNEGGFTWNRGTCYSRLDYIYVSNTLKSRIVTSGTDWAFDRSDHAAVITKIRIKEEINKGPGITTINVEIMKDPFKISKMREELIFVLNQIPIGWNGHTKLEYLKMSIRSIFSKFSGMDKRENKNELEDLEMSLNDIEKLRLKILAKKNTITDEELVSKMDKVDKVKLEIVKNIESLRSKQGKQYDFATTAKWYEYGEKPNKFFLNLSTFRSKQKIIDEIKDGVKEYVGHKKVIEGIKDFYQNLYKKSNINESISDSDECFFDLCPKISEKNKEIMEGEITINELYKSLTTCKDSAPGPDGIPYSVYKIFWPQVGAILKEAWDYSNTINKMADSHRESVITILPKDGKDLSDIKNWRPITLTNCDAKILTKALSNRISPILDTIIDPSQTAYIPGRSVMDNIRANRFVKNYCKTNKIDAVLASLDARKAFDSVNHEYIDTVLEKYGFGPNFRKYFRIIYNDLSAKIMVNGYLSEKINIERGVKQGDALSCAIFILCIDPLIRNINSNSKIKQVVIKNSKNRLLNSHKASGFADDISVICRNDRESVELIFKEYQRLTDKSGLTLNADKTELINLNTESKVESYEVQYEKQIVKIKCINSLKICGIYFCNNSIDEYNKNVFEKITKLLNKLKLWQSRHLTLEGKSLILKTFGISQLIYNMQCVTFEPKELKCIEQYIFNFLWNTRNINESKARDRIKRTVMKNDYVHGGLKITDIECLDKSLKLKQYIRANKSNHIIREIQIYCTKNSGGNNTLDQEFKTVTKEEEVCNVAQETLNIIVDYSRNEKFGELEQQEIISTHAINQIAMTNLETYLSRKNRVFLSCIIKPFIREGVETYLDIVNEAEIEKNKTRLQKLESIISAFPKYFRNAALSFDENINVRNESITHFVRNEYEWVPVSDITTKDLQWILKKALHRITEADYRSKLDVENEIIDPVKFRQDCKNPKLRNIYFRMIHNDFYTYSRMFKFNMTNSPNCPRCGQIETTKHLLWECYESQKMWNCYNDVLVLSNLENMKIEKYDDLYRTETLGILSIVKTKLTQELIQIVRPVNWNINRTIEIINKMRNIEIYNTNINNKCLHKINKKWEPLTFNF